MVGEQQRPGVVLQLARPLERQTTGFDRVVLPPPRVPNREADEHGGLTPQGEDRRPARRGGLTPEEGQEDPVVSRVLIAEEGRETAIAE